MIWYESERLILRDWRESDLTDIVDGLNAINVSKWLAFVPFPYTVDDAARFLSLCADCAEKTDELGRRYDYMFAIALKADDKAIGGTSLNRIDYEKGMAGGGIWLNARYHGLGYGTEAFAARCAFAFDALKLHKLENGFLVGNEISRKMQEKIGYRIVGLKKDAYLVKATGAMSDEVLTEIDEETWKMTRRTRE